jgi:hypothetical protein
MRGFNGKIRGVNIWVHRLTDHLAQESVLGQEPQDCPDHKGEKDGHYERQIYGHMGVKPSVQCEADVGPYQR